MLVKDVKMFYEKTFATLRGIVESFPQDRWLKPHGDEYYIPCRIAYHLAIIIDRTIAGGSKDPDFNAKIPYGPWMEATAATLPEKKDFLVYFNAVLARAEKELAKVDAGSITAPTDPERPFTGSSELAMMIYCLREIAAHTGELNKMLIENGEPDIWIFR